MRGLLIKDWGLFKNQGRYFFGIMVIAMAIMLVNSKEYSSFVTSYITFFCAYFTLSTISYDEYDNGMGFLMTLPVSRRIYVKEKYMLCALLTLGTWFLSVLLNMFFLVSGGAKAEEWQEMVCTSFLFLMFILLFLSISLPLFLKFGPEKGRMVSFGIIGVGILAAILMVKMGIGISAVKSLDMAALEQPVLVVGASIVISILAVAVSYIVSAAIMEKREF